MTSAKHHSPKRPRWLRRTAALLLGVMLVVLAAFWLALQYKPPWFRPPVLDAAGRRQARVDAVNTADFISDQLMRNEPFDVDLTAAAINEWLAAWPESHPDSYRNVPPEFTRFAVHFESGRMYLGAHFANKGWEAILNLAFSARLNDDGSAIIVALSKARIGACPIPQRNLEKLLTDLREQADVGVDRREAFSSALQSIRSVDDVVQGIAIPNRFTWFNGKRSFTIENVTLDKGALRLRLHPR